MQLARSSFRSQLALLIVFSIISSGFYVPLAQAQTSSCSSQVSGKTRTQLEAELEACNKEIAQWTAELNKAKQNSASFSRDIQVLTAKINAAQANIKSRNIAIANLSKDIAVKQTKITQLGEKIKENKLAVANVLRRTNEINSYSLAEALLSNKDFSEFFVDLDTYASTEKALSVLLDELDQMRNLTESEKAELDKKRQAEASAKAAIELAKKEIEISQKDKKKLLADSQNQEKSYAQVVAEKQAAANKIREALFPLRDAGPIQFGTALQYAEEASAKTGVRAALILGILQQESNLGANVGSCVITDIQSGQTKSVNSGKIFANGIHPSRDLPTLQSILGDLGREPLSTKVSCPVSSTFGYGGAMGPAQFIPSTWNLMAGQIKSLTGKATPDPWSARDAIMASALLLKGNGAAGGSYEAERTAACKYYSGRTCSYGPAATYGNSVMAKASNIQLTMIDPLKGL